MGNGAPKTPPEIHVQRVYPLRFAAEGGQNGYGKMFQLLHGAPAYARSDR